MDTEVPGGKSDAFCSVTEISQVTKVCSRSVQ